MTGDRNLLHGTFSVQFRISEEDVVHYLSDSTSPEERLRYLAESLATDFILRCGVDFVHPGGLNSLQSRLTSQLRRLAETQQLGIDVESVMVEQIQPPLRVKADFLDVANARAEREQSIQNALSYADQRQFQAVSEARVLKDEALTFREQRTVLAKGRAAQFQKMLKQVESSDKAETMAAHQLILERKYLDVMTTLLSKVKTKVMLPSDQPLDLTIIPDEN